MGKLTDRQIRELYFHKRTKEGTIGAVEKQDFREGTLQDELLALDQLRGVLKLDDAHVEALKQKVREKWANKEH